MAGFILRANEIDDLDFFDTVNRSAEGLILSTLFMLKNGYEKQVPALRSILGDRLLILDVEDTGYDEQELLDFQTAFNQFKGIDGIMALGNYGIERIAKESGIIQGRLYYVIDTANENWNKRFSDDERIAFAKEAKRCGCKGVVMSVKNPGRINSVRKAIGPSPTIMADCRNLSDIGAGITAGADYEILTSEFWERRQVRKRVETVLEGLALNRR